MANRIRARYSASVFVILRRGGEVCVLKRAGTGWMDGHFSLPAGGLEPGETLFQAAVREAAEETGVSLRAGSLEHVHVLHCRTDGESWFGHFFSTDEWTGEPEIREPDKHADLRWAPLDDLPSPMVPYVGAALNAIRTGGSYSEYGWA